MIEESVIQEFFKINPQEAVKLVKECLEEAGIEYDNTKGNITFDGFNFHEEPIMTIKEIDKEISRLQNLRYEAEKKEIAEFKEKAKENVGRCFIIDGCDYVKVIDIPKEIYTKAGIDFNKYQYPALYLTNKENLNTVELPFEYDTLFSGAWGEGCYLPHKEYKEITQEEFSLEFDRIIKKWRKKIIYGFSK